MNISSVKIKLFKREGTETKVKAFASALIGDALFLHNMKVIQGAKGLFISMPSEKGKDGEWHDIAYPKDKATKDELETIILAEYTKALSEGK